MTYLVHSIFHTIQGEGHWTGRPAVFIRMSRCNLWTGREEDRAKATCTFCDTDFLHGDKYELDELVAAVQAVHPPPPACPCSGGGTCQRCEYGHYKPELPMIVFTGGEPSLQVDQPLIRALHTAGYYLAIETNGTRELPRGLDWVCVSPKPAELKVLWGDELKLVYPQAGMEPEKFQDWPFDHFWLSPMDLPNLTGIHTTMALEYCLAHPQWRLNIQTHKMIGVR